MEPSGKRHWIIGGTYRMAWIEANRAGWKPDSWKHLSSWYECRGEKIRPEDELMYLPTDHLNFASGEELMAAVRSAQDRGREN